LVLYQDQSGILASTYRAPGINAAGKEKAAVGQEEPLVKDGIIYITDP